MGVHGLWELLAPVGRRVSMETLSGKKLAIDASIWMIQFMKAMRDERGDMVKNAHLLGFFRRICKLLFLRTKPVFVFDGGTPVLKRRTVIARRRQRENAQAKIRKTAEKLLLNHLKTMNLKELASGIGNLKQKNAMCKKVLPNISDSGDISTSNEMKSGSFELKKEDKLLAATLATEERVSNTGTTSGAEILSEEHSDDEDDDEDEEMILPALHGKIDPAVLASLPPSMQLDLLVQMRERLMAENRQKYQRVKKAPTKFSELQVQSYLKTVAFRREIDSVQKSASGRGAGGVRVSRIASEANKEFIFSSSFIGDKGILTPGNDHNGINRGRFPSEQSSDKTLFGVLSSSNDDTATASRDNALQTEENIHNDNAIVSCLGNFLSETANRDNDDVETYLDDRGTRVSRGRALGIRMTRDLERNLNLMKEIDHEKKSAEKFATSAVTSSQGISGVDRVFNPEVVNVEASNVDSDEIYNENDGLGGSISNNRSEPIIPDSGFTIELSFGDHDESNRLDADDIMFASLVSGRPLKSPVDESQCEETSSDLDFDWEEEAFDVKRNVQCDDFVPNVGSLHSDGAICSESDIEWEDGGCDDHEDKFSSKTACSRDVSRGALEEDVNLREAIKRSLEDFENMTSSTSLPERKVRELASKEESLESSRFMLDLPSQHILQQDLQLHEVIGDANLELKNDVSNPHSLDSFTDANIENLKGDVWKESNPAEICRERFSSMIEIEENEPSVVCSSDTRNGLTTAVCSSVNANICLGIFKDKFVVNHKEPCSTVNENVLQELDDTVSQRERNHDGGIVGSSQINLEDEMNSLAQECLNLADEQIKLERNVDIATSEMFAECQELLQMFGLPYIIAPMEAEAQCAYMELVNLVDGVVTDDSDAFLFGARSIYKNIFDDRKYVETYFMKDIESELGLSREKLIRMALLLGSDYTEGISGIGIVNAMEVVNAFPEENGLNEFRMWIESPDPSILKEVTEQTKSITQTNGAKHCSDTDCPEINDDTFSITGIEVSKHNRPTDEHVRNGKHQFMNKHRKVSKNWHIPTSFPSETVISAYACPQIDNSMDPFSWGKPDHFALRRTCCEKFGWVNQKADDILIPVLNEYNKHETQLRLEAFYTFNERFAKIRSNRIKKAVKGITGKQPAELMGDDDAAPHSRGRMRRKIADPLAETVDSAAMPATLTPQQPRKRKANSSSSDAEESSPAAAAATGVAKVRRSSRQRKTVNYKMMDEDMDDANENNGAKATDGTDHEYIGCSEESKVTAEVGNDVGLLPSSSKVGPCSPDYVVSGGGFCVEEDSSTRVGKQAQVVNPFTPIPSLRRKPRKS